MSDRELEMKPCPRCGNPAAGLVTVDTGMRLLLQKNPDVGELPSQVCQSCYSSLTGAVSQGVKLRLEQQAREKNRHMLWKSRVNLVKHARQMMLQKAYSEAAVSYEKYIRVLEISYDLKSGQLNPSVFGKSMRSKELTVIATTYWDLMRVYDTAPQYRERMVNAARKLAEFIPYSTIFPDMAKKAQAFKLTAKNPDIVNEFMRLAKISAGRCFIASAAFEYPGHPVVLDLRNFRDHHLIDNRLGRKFVAFYYLHSRPIAKFLNRHTWLKPPVRFALYMASAIIKKFLS
jgi:hypothetical protein